MNKIYLLFTAFVLLQITTPAQEGWYQQTSGTTENLRGVSFTDSDNGTVVGDNVTILRTTNGGMTWVSQLSGTTSSLRGVSFTDSVNGTAVGWDGTILRTTDGGSNWTQQSSGTTVRLEGVSFTDKDNGTAVGFVGTILRTTNGGTTWTSPNSGTGGDWSGVSFTDVNNGTVVGSGGQILRTSDGGITWTLQLIGIHSWYTGVSFTDSANGTVTGEDGDILRTTDGGTTWTSQPTGFADEIITVGVCFTDVNNGTVVGYNYFFERGLVLRTTNGGKDWTEQTSGTTDWLNGVSFTDSYNGTAVGYGGTILRTTNGGVIPVELTAFTASTSKGTVTLNWTTATETNNHLFEIERSIGDGQFTTIGYVEGHGTTTEIQSYQYIDNVSDIQATSLSYRLKQIDYDGSFEYSEVVEVTNPAPTDFVLHQNYPNPFNPTTRIKYSIPSNVKSETPKVSLKVYDILGNEVVTLVNEEKTAGSFNVAFDATSLPSGVYFYRLTMGSYAVTKKMLYLK